tara:strand:+ start:2534 stop:2674 length:141 start_codon:yes stop_codon:yes gene_type:complete
MDQDEKEYEVNVSGTFTVLAYNQEDANRWIKHHLSDYISELEVGDD